MKLFNTLTRQKDTVKPLNDILKIYTCGLTVYSQPHIGNWVSYIYWDILIRLLKYQDIKHLRVQNITDVGHLTSDDDSGEDKMEAGAKREGKTAWDIAEKYIQIANHEAYEVLKLHQPDQLVRATDCIVEQIDIVKSLEEKGYTYIIEGDGVYFDTSKLIDYGKLARLDVSGLEAGARVSVAGKKNITDFAIWKFSPKDTKRDMEWDSPWGKGFPGWHLECSAITLKTLGEQIDIHTGGIDHIPVHHTNEIAQTESLTEKPFSQIWVHNNHIKVDGKKMSKSLGNIITLTDITDRNYSPMAFKLTILAKHYQTEGNFSWDILKASQNRLDNWRNYAALRHQAHQTLAQDDQKHIEESANLLTSSLQLVVKALNDNLDTPKALAVIDSVFTSLDRYAPNNVSQQALTRFLESVDQLLGLSLIESSPDIDDDTKRLILERSRAREDNDWAKSDSLRERLAAKGIMVRDTPKGPIWSYIYQSTS